MVASGRRDPPWVTLAELAECDPTPADPTQPVSSDVSTSEFPFAGQSCRRAVRCRVAER